MREQKRQQTYRETRADYLAGRLTGGQAVERLMAACWSQADAGLAVRAWRTLRTLPPARPKAAAGPRG